MSIQKKKAKPTIKKFQSQANSNARLCHHPSATQDSADKHLKLCDQTFSMQDTMKIVGSLNPEQLLQLTDKLFGDLAVSYKIYFNVTNFCALALDAMLLLQQNNKSNLLYKFASALTAKHPDTKECILQMNRMPFGLLQYQIEFFSCTNISQVCSVTSMYYILIGVEMS